jgi:hypothetical protein
MKRRDVERQLRKLGWRPFRHGRRHDVWGWGERELVLPRHAEINEYTAEVILRAAAGEHG